LELIRCVILEMCLIADSSLRGWKMNRIRVSIKNNIIADIAESIREHEKKFMKKPRKLILNKKYYQHYFWNHYGQREPTTLFGIELKLEYFKGEQWAYKYINAEKETVKVFMAENIGVAISKFIEISGREEIKELNRTLGELK